MADNRNVPRHIAIIMDGNGRWAKKRGMPRTMGHAAGAEAFRRTANYCRTLGVEYLTVYAFSTENWKRPKREVDAIMNLLDDYLDRDCPPSISIRIIGDISVLEPRLQDKIRKIQDATAGRKNILNIAINYGSRAEIVHACNQLISEGKTSVTEKDIISKLYTCDCPDPDLIIRTGGDIRISNFLLWQAAYSELYFTDTLWPDMTEDDLLIAVENFNKRKRRYGGLDK